MTKTRMIFTVAVLALTPLFLASCSSKGGKGSHKVPTVIVTENPTAGTDTGTTTTTAGTGSSSGGSASSGTAAGSDSASSGGSSSSDSGSSLVVILKPDAASGKLTINGESIDPALYSASNISVTSSSGTAVPYTVDGAGDIIIVPADGTAAGTYNITITADGRVYFVVVTVDSENIAKVDTAISYASGKAPAIDLDGGVLSSGAISLVISSSGFLTGIFTGYTLDSSISEMIIRDASGTAIGWTVDPVTGDIVVAGGSSAPFTVDIYTADGQHYVFKTDANGAISGSITVSGRAVALDLDGGKVNSGSTVLTLASDSGSSWTFASNVTVLSVTAGASDAPVDVSAVSIDAVSGDMMIEGSGAAAPAGPYTIKVSVGSDIYIIKADAAGAVMSILAGNVLLKLDDGSIRYNGGSLIAACVQDTNSGTWSLSPKITGLKAEDENGSAVAVSIDPSTGNFVTPAVINVPVTIGFSSIDAAGNTIHYTITVFNGSVTFYQAAVTNPGPNFDYSTVTNVTVSLRVADSISGLPVAQASISFIDANGKETWKGYTDASGSSLFSASVAVISSTARIRVVHAGYEDVNSDVSGADKVIAFGRNITMVPVPVAIAPVDTDGDGVADADDDYPGDANGAKMLTTVTTFGFEDLYEVGTNNKATFNTSSTDGNDADFNDLVVRMTVVEKIDSQNKVRAIRITADILATLAGYTNAFGVYINDGLSAAPSQYILTYKPVAGTAASMDKEYPDGIARAALGAAPYDPFIVPNYGSASCKYKGPDGHFVRRVSSSTYVPNEVHLASAVSAPGFAYTGPLTGTGSIKGYVNGVYSSNAKISRGFAWALMIPEGWRWPAATVSIGVAYPKFIDWCNSDGTVNTDWYNYPDMSKVIAD